jgi:adenine-specific DNA methylase
MSMVESAQKLRGGYYTPRLLASWLTDWAVQTSADTVLEPSCGDGIFVDCAIQRLRSLGATPGAIVRQVRAVEIAAAEARKASERGSEVLRRARLPVVAGDFFDWSLANRGLRFDCIVGNPPFIRYQNFPEPSRSRAMSIMVKSGLAPNRLTNIWVPFVVAAANHLAPNGRLAMVLPAELLQVSYAAQLRSFLVDRFADMELVSCNDLVFKHAQQEVVLLLASGRLEAPDATNRCGINLIEAQSAEQVLAHHPMRSRRTAKVVNHDSEKWLKYFLSTREIAFMRALRRHDKIARLSQHAEIDVGVVTGRNEFFVLTNDEVKKHRLEEWAVPLVGRSAQLRGAIIDKREHDTLAEAGSRVFLLAIAPATNGSLSAAARRYIASGETRGIHTGYKCSVRTPWYSVPAVWEPDCFFFRQIYDFPRVVVNRTAATSTDTIHRMRCRSARPDLLASNLYTYLTAASAEIEGRSYGGGVLELEPTEAEKLLVPDELGNGMPIGELDRLVRQGKLADALESNSNLVLSRLGLTQTDCRLLRSIWHKMRDRRMARKRRAIA